MSMKVDVTTTEQLTREQAYEAQQFLIAECSSPKMQAEFDQLEIRAKGNVDAYEFLLGMVLTSEVYPKVLKLFGIPREQLDAGQKLIFGSIANWSMEDKEMGENWLKLETIMRNKKNIAMAQVILSEQRANLSRKRRPRPEDQLERYSAGMAVQILTAGSKVETMQSRSQAGGFVDASGQCGQVMEEYEEERYVIQTFEGLRVLVNGKDLELCQLPRPVEGGSDIIYPIGGLAQELGKAVADWLAYKGFCMIQMSESKETRQTAAGIARDVGEELEDTFRQELESAYLGIGNVTHVKALLPEMIDEDPSLKVLSQQVVSSLNAVGQLTEEYFGEACWATTSLWARVSEARDDISDPPPLQEKDIMEGSHIQAYERFIQGRRICVLYMVENSGGEIHLFPRHNSALDAAGFAPVKIPISGNKMLVFRHDQLSYSYQPRGPSFALQSWLLTDIPFVQQNMKVAELNGVKEPPPGENAQIMMVDSRMPGVAYGADKLWSMFAHGTDCATIWPESRWPLEPYYSEGDDWMTTGKSYTCHGSFMEMSAVIYFDHEFFGLRKDTGELMSPHQRHVTEVGYQCLYKAGHTRASLERENIGVFMGDSGMDWASCNAPWSVEHHGMGTLDDLCAGVHNGCTANRLSFIFDMRGPTQTADTACSSSLVALQAGHKALMHGNTDMWSADTSISAAHSILAGGVACMMNPMQYPSTCAAQMLTHTGRCWTFDRTADGYQRGEGTGMMFIKWSGDLVDMEERFACLVGSCSGHDGRSASLTSPNGPAQQDVIRRSMRMAGVDPSLISVCECHGTGTALGDPIEIGSLQGVMRGMRKFPLLNTSAKTNCSHLEPGAGILGIMKCVLMVMHSAGPANCHLRAVNPNLITDGYPVFFQQELCDTTFSTTFIGVSSFGFGGTNSRADVYGRCLYGASATGNVWTNERRQNRDFAYTHGLRKTFKGYDKLDATIVPHVPIYIMGSWDNFGKVAIMQQEEPGLFTYRVKLGETRQAYFQLCMAGDRSQRLYPAANKASSKALICGPGFSNREGENKWLIDGRNDAAHEGATYCITFKWQGEKSITWVPETTWDALADEEPVAYDDYYIVGTWGSFLMSCISPEDGLHKVRLPVGEEGFSKFQFRCANDIHQTIYPDESGSACGPDMDDRGKSFEIRGSPSEEIVVQLCVKDRQLKVSAVLDGGASFEWQGHTNDDWTPPSMNKQEAPKSEYYLCGSWGFWRPVKMSCISVKDGIYEGDLYTDMSGLAKFQFQRANNANQTIYLDNSGSICGPDKAGKGKNFAFRGPCKQKLKVQLAFKNASINVAIFSENGVEESWVSNNVIAYYVSGSFNGYRYSRLYEDRYIKGLYRCHVDVLDDEIVNYEILVNADGTRNLQGLSALFPDADKTVLNAVRDFKGKIGSSWEILVDLNQDDPERIIYHRPATYAEDMTVISM